MPGRSRLHCARVMRGPLPAVRAGDVFLDRVRAEQAG
jgi:hypothetical protein